VLAAVGEFETHTETEVHSVEYQLTPVPTMGEAATRLIPDIRIHYRDRDRR